MLSCLLARWPTSAPATERFAAASHVIACCRSPAFTWHTPFPLLAPAAYYLAPPLLKAGVGFLRGYAGDIAPAAALSAVESEVRLGDNLDWGVFAHFTQLVMLLGCTEPLHLARLL